MPTPPYNCTGIGADLLPYAALSFVMTSERALGTTDNAIPDGAINREFHKLLMNTGALADQFAAFLAASYGTYNSNAPAANSIPDPLPGPPTTPANSAVHFVYWNDYVVTYIYNGTDGEWEEKFRKTKVATVVTRYHRKVTVPLGDGDSDVSIPIPTATDEAAAFEFTKDDLRLVYVDNLDEDAPIIGLVIGFQAGSTVIRAALTTEVPADNDYSVVAIFERLVTA